MKNPVAWSGVVRFANPVKLRELTSDTRLLVVGLDAREDEVIVGNRRLPRIDRVAAGDLVEGMNREGGGAVGRRQEIGVDAQRGARLQLVRPEVLVNTMRPDDLLRRGHSLSRVLVGPVDRGRRADGCLELATAHFEDTAAAPDLFFFG